MDDHNPTSRRQEICPGKKSTLNLESVRSQIENAADPKTGPEYWRSLEELAGSAEFQEALQQVYRIARFRMEDIFAR